MLFVKRTVRTFGEREREYFKHAAISSALVPFGMTGNVCLKSPASIKGRLPMSAKLFRMSRRDLPFCLPWCIRPKLRLWRGREVAIAQCSSEWCKWDARND